MNEETTLEGVKWRFSGGEHDDGDVRWLLAEVDRLRAQVAAIEELMPYFSTMDYYGDEVVSQLEKTGLRKPKTDD